MKLLKILLFNLVSFLFISNLSYAQIEEYCGTEGIATQMAMSSQGDGEYITAHGTLRVLVVFVRFPDDNTAHNHWPASGFPNLADSFIDPTTSTVDAGNYWNVTNYFKEMSLGQYNVIGDVEKVVAPYASNDSRYSGLSDNQFRRKANQDVLDYIDNNTSITFADYDNWTRNSSYVHSDSSDGVVDMIFMIWKGTWFGGFRGEASMGYGSGSLLVDNGNTEIKFGFPTGSGVTIHDNSSATTLLNSVKHELGHWLLGFGHPYFGSQHTRIASMLHWAEPQALSVSAPERERLGWITVPEVSQGTSSELLDDFITTGEALKYKVPDGAANEYYYFTNHQNISMYDDARVNDDDKGIFILHDRNSHTNSSSNRYLLSDGDWDWENVGEVINPWGDGSSTIPAFERKKVNLEGQNFSTIMPVDGGGFKWLYALVDSQSADTVVATHFRGVNMKSSFSIDNQAKFSQLTNPKPTTWNESSVPFAMKITSEFLGMVALQFNTNDDPYTITENTTWDGEIFLHQTTKVENNATLTILPGTTVYLAEDVNLSIRSGLGGKLIAEGTEEDPIRFLRADPDKAWGTIYLNSSEPNSIKWALFDGGSTNLTIASQNNTIEHSTFRNATFRNIDSWHNQDGSGTSNASLSHVLIEDGATVGLVAQFIDLDISNTTIQNNAQAGIYITSASVYPFHRNEVINNGGSWRDGVEVMSSGTFYMHDDNLEDGFNVISGNGDDQVSGSGDISVGFFFPESNGGYNSVYGDFSGSSFLVNNLSSTTVMAERVWWEQNLQPEMFNGPVQFDMWALHSDPTIGENPGSGGQTPAKALPGKEGEVLPLVEVFDHYEKELENAETQQQLRDGLHRLHQVAWLGEREYLDLTDRFRNLAVQFADSEAVLYASSHLNTALRDAALVLQGKSLMRSGEYEKASRWLAGRHGKELSGHDRRDWLHLEVDLLRYRGEYRQALEVLSDLYSYESSRGTDMDEFRGLYQPIEEDIAMRLGDDSGQLAEPQKQAEKIAAEVEITLQNYPNPFNPTTMISYQLPAQSEVRLDVFDMLGRRVAVLVDGHQPAGTYSAEFDASNLASGVYLYRLHTGESVQTQQMVLVK